MTRTRQIRSSRESSRKDLRGRFWKYDELESRSPSYRMLYTGWQVAKVAMEIGYQLCIAIGPTCGFPVLRGFEESIKKAVSMAFSVRSPVAYLSGGGAAWLLRCCHASGACAPLTLAEGVFQALKTSGEASRMENRSCERSFRRRSSRWTNFRRASPGSSHSLGICDAVSRMASRVRSACSRLSQGSNDSSPVIPA